MDREEKKDQVLGEVVQRISELLGEDSGVPAAGRHSATGHPNHGASSYHPGDRIGSYKLLEQIGVGGSGSVVYSAQRGDPIRHFVAIKILDSAAREIIARFEAERQALALMDHPNIAKVMDAGATEKGHPYFVMELVRGRNIKDHCEDNPLPTRDKLLLFLQVCHAVHHAHQKGIIHRDIKPSNILVTSLDGAPVVKVIDFGIAKATQPLTDKTVFTSFHHFIGTPAYMSPEQMELGGVDVDVCTDIYSLGVLLYELLTGTTPFDSKQLLAASFDEMRRIIREKEPLRPSTRLTQVIEGTNRKRNHSAAAFQPATESPGDDSAVRLRLKESIRHVRGDLDWIVMKCLEKDRGRRYKSVDGLRADLERHLNHEPISARPPSGWYRLGRMVRRNRAGAMAGLTALLLVVVVAIGAPVTAVRIEGARREAEQQHQKAERGLVIQKMSALQSQVHSAGWFQNGWALAQAAMDTPAPDGNSTLTDEAAALLAGFDAHLIWQMKNQPASSAAFDPKGQRLIMGSVGEGPTLWEQQSGVVSTPARLGSGPALFASDGIPVQVFFDAERQTLVEMNVLNAQPIAEWRAPAPVAMGMLGTNSVPVVALTADGNLGVAVLQIAATNEAVALFGPGGFRTLGNIPGPIGAVTISPDGSLVAAADATGTLNVWSTADGRLLQSLPNGRNPVLCLQFKMSRLSPESDPGQSDQPNEWLLAAGDVGGGLAIWNLRTATIKTICHGYLQIYAVAFNPDGTLLAAGGRGDVRIFDVASGKLVLDLSAGDSITGLAFSPDGRHLGVSSVRLYSPGILSLWELEPDRGIKTLRGLSGHVSRVCFSEDGRKLAALSQSWDIGIWDVASNSLERIFEAPRGDTPDNAGLAFSPDGSLFAFSTGEGARVWDLTSGGQVVRVQLPRGLTDALAFDAKGRLLLFRTETRKGISTRSGDWLSSDKDPRVCRIRDLLSQHPEIPLAELNDFDQRVHGAIATPRAERFVVAGKATDGDGSANWLKAFDGATLKVQWAVPLTVDPCPFVVDPIRQILHSGSGENSLVLNIATGQPVLDPLPVRPSAIAPGGDLWVVADKDWSIWQRGINHPVVTLHTAPIYDARFPVFSPEGKLLAWGEPDGTVSVCDLPNIRAKLKELGLGW
jgi:serine/threonine protein kinase/WD40 repeat protein/type II secretory pathway pseudopilin PulG